jgi:ferric-dicitrate binding protein FerR (iron transport regulator)
MTENRFWNLLAKKLSGEALPNELAELEQLMKLHPEWVYAAEHIESLWKLKAREDIYDSEVAFELHLENNQRNGLHFPELDTPATITELTQEPQRPKKRWITVSAVLLLLLLGGAFFWYGSAGKRDADMDKKGFSEVTTRLGSKTKLLLPDSTVVWLNAGSKLTYGEQFGVNNRNTTLVGEAFFDVRKSSIPFIIHAHSVQIKVMGTAFNVKSYANEKTTETSLIRGRVEITLDKRPGEKFILKPNEKLVVANEMEDQKPEALAQIPEPLQQRKEPMVVLSGLTRSKDDNTIIETSWVENKLIFQDESFADIIRKLERWYDVHIDIRNEKLAQVRMTGTFENETVKQALTALQIASPFNFSISQKNITITP